MAIATVNPATGETLETFEELSDREIEARLSTACAAFAGYRLTSFAQRAEWMQAAGDLLEAESDSVAQMLTAEMGKTLVAARQEVLKCAKAGRYFAQHAEEFLADEPADPDSVGAVTAYSRWEPLGVVLAVMPWNFPLWQAIRFAVPALMAGNVGLLKHASNVPRTALYLQDLIERAGFPPGAFQTLLIGSAKVEALLRDPRVVAATLTGSEAAGRAVASVAGGEIKKTVLELGGSDPFVVMPSADLARAAKVGATARCLNNGQSCIAAKRFIVHQAVAEDFQRLFVAEMSALRLGDPMQEGTDVGPLATRHQQRDVAELVDDALGKGAALLCGGAIPEGPGFYYPPTVLTGIDPSMRVHLEEVFGPVATLYRVGSIDEAVELANVTPFGLGANVWTEDAGERERFVRELEAGMVFVNGSVTSYPELPFGGVKRSGYGRELTAHGIREFCYLKAVWVGA